MIVKLDTQRLQTLDQVREFLAGSRPLDLQPQTRAEAYAFVAETLQRFDYSRQGKADKGLIRRFLNKVTGLSRAQVTRLLHQHAYSGPNRSLIPAEIDHRFRSKSITRRSRAARDNPPDVRPSYFCRRDERWRTGGCPCARFERCCGCISPRR